ncbi:T complex protein 1 subunit beta [Trichuris trichiura]|uniref:T-complex protein 1 subunit beta n=1 Tax=Trichuris trichiura TaxID=36087 RepID=A0A077ZGW0_TRITR|nr:T complex protein 1 subunit beta [Trichuris trichiura]
MRLFIFQIIFNPVQILEPAVEEEKGEEARLSSFIGAMAIGDLLKSTLGPKGMDKILVSSQPGSGDQVKVTNDGATILKSIGVDNPAAKVLVDISLVQDSEVGDGTTTVVVLAASLLKQAERLMEEQHLHPQTIIAGWRKALEVCRDELRSCARVSSSNAEEFRNDLQKIAETTLGSKILASYKEQFAKLAVDAALRTKRSETSDSVTVIKVLGGSLTDSYLDDGFLLPKQPGLYQPQRIEKARILIANTAMDVDKIKVYDARFKVGAVSKLAELELAEKERMKNKVNKILAHDINVFINRQLIYNYPEQLFADAKVMAIEHADFSGIEQLALVLGGDIVSTFDNPKKSKLGYCDLIELVQIGEKTYLRFSGVPVGAACSIVVFGATEQIVDEAERSLHDALCVLSIHMKEAKVVLGGGCSEVAMATAVSAVASRTPGKQALAMESFARALLHIPEILAENGGYDSAELVSQIRAAHARGKKTYGLDMNDGTVGDMMSMGIYESYRVKLSALNSAAEAAEMLLRVDNIIKDEPRKRDIDERPC